MKQLQEMQNIEKKINSIKEKVLKIFISQKRKLSNYLTIMLKLDLKQCIKQNLE